MGFPLRDFLQQDVKWKVHDYTTMQLLRVIRHYVNRQAYMVSIFQLHSVALTLPQNDATH